jgi:hypothetical protein
MPRSGPRTVRRHIWAFAFYTVGVVLLRWLRLRDAMSWGDVVEIVLAGLFFAWLFERFGPAGTSRAKSRDHAA